MTVTREYDVAEMLAKLCIRNACNKNTCPVGNSMDCSFHPELLCGDITSEDWIFWMYEEEKEMAEAKKQNAAEMLTRVCHLEADYGGNCPVGDGDDCPFPKKLCVEVTPEDWKAWMEEDE